MTKKVTKQKTETAKRTPKTQPASHGMEAKVYNQKGKESGSVALPETVFGLTWNGDLVHQVVESIRSNMRTPVAHTKDRSDVAGGGKKPWRQKGTGRARHGSIRSPLWRGGGVAHGPRNEKVYAKKINKKMRAKALYTVLSEKLRSGHVLFVDTLDFSAPKTKDAKGVVGALAGIKGFEKLSTKRTNTAIIALPGRNIAAEKSFRNFSNMEVMQAKDLNPYAVLNHKYLVIAGPEESVKTIASRMAKTA